MTQDHFTIPQHIAIIMDGNGRWASSRGMPHLAGHRAGIEAVRRCLNAAGEFGIPHLTLYGFSSENWKRPPKEVQDLMGLLRFYLQGELANLHKEGVRLSIIGEREKFEPDIVRLIEEAEKLTSNNTGIHLIMALSYGGRHELVRGVKKLAEKAARGEISAEAIDEAALQRELYTAAIPDPDLIIRTSGEKRLSNFLLWQSAYAEFVFLDTLWPDFSREDLARALDEFNRRERRYGARVG
jgi:undecaprenyl diphosphate synthase